MLWKIVLTLPPAAVNGRDRHERDQRHEQRVLEQVLALIVANERLHEVNKLHEILPQRVCTARMRCELRHSPRLSNARGHCRVTVSPKATGVPRLIRRNW